MSKRIEIHALEVVRRIRDQQAERLHGKSDKEIIEFFGRVRKSKQKRNRTRRRTAANKSI